MLAQAIETEHDVCADRNEPHIGGSLLSTAFQPESNLPPFNRPKNP
ncbi:hypothetical protein RBSH_01166 [Rhodopirellula baltica SH28]|uniref:Uncharacterized protein n=1 Tax=Rhodopirellula baltica SH28 TaxID=993517 RepID=K5DAD4_RHOBT|nr:hypothetical protein RBSH_01166 [Rhodopirellula baltica SH28]